MQNVTKKLVEAIISPYKYIVINRISGRCIYLSSWSGVTDLINNEGKNNFIIFDLKDEIRIDPTVAIIKEEDESIS